MGQNLVLRGTTYRYQASTGTAFITVNHDYAGLYETFCNVGKAGSDVFDFSEAIGRLVSLVLQMPDGLSREERTKLVIHQLEGIGGSRQSVPDAVARALEEESGRQRDSL